MAKTGDGESLGTAEGAVMGRAAHALHAEDPVLDDHWAIHLLGEASRAQVTSPDYLALSIERAGFDASRILAIGVGALRYAEDEVERCVARGVGQYVILGAGFDTFALRRADLVDRLVVFEVDHPDGFAGGDERYRYDAAGNRVESHLSSGYSYGYQTGSGGRTFLRMPQT